MITREIKFDEIEKEKWERIAFVIRDRYNGFLTDSKVTQCLLRKQIPLTLTDIYIDEDGKWYETEIRIDIREIIDKYF